MERVLFIMGNMGLGGAETHIMKVFRGIDKEQYQFDFVLNVPEKCYYEDEINLLGGKCYRVTPKSTSIFRNYIDIKRIIKENDYNVVLKCGEQAMSWTEMLAAKQGGAKVRIMRSTNSKGGTSKISNTLHAISRIPLCWFTTVKVAPSQIAGEWLFGKDGCKDLVLINNGVNLSEYRYSEERRKNGRLELSIPEDAVVLGHVGRFNDQKNHDFLVDIFDAYHKFNSNSVLLLIGDGPLKEQIEKKVEKLNLTDSVVFAGNRSDANRLYSMMDMFVFPSFYEGMPNTVIEAQAGGLSCFVSDTITREANITGKVEYIPLGDALEWVEKMKDTSFQHYSPEDAFKQAGFDIESVIRTYESIFDKRRVH